MTKVILLLSLVILISCSVMAGDDLYLVSINNSQELGRLIELDGKVVHYGAEGIIVLINSEKSDQLFSSGLNYQLLAGSVAVDRLVTDAVRERPYSSALQPVYQAGQFKLILVNEAIKASTFQSIGLHPLKQGMPLSAYQPSVPFDGQFASPTELTDLVNLIANVSQDSLWSFVTHLQTFPSRLAGSSPSRDARDWIKSKFEEFGYSGVKLDTFDVRLNGNPVDCYNVIATKIGSVYPDYKVVIGAHFDAVASSPGADDNGSGTSAVLEIARILKDVDTDMTIEFVLYDAEEFGLLGAWHHVSESYLAGEKIVFMMNQDMIGFIPNTNTANIFYGIETQYAIRFAQLADSLLGLNVILQGSSAASDHYPYSQFGIPVAFAAEYIFSTVYHKPTDSTSYMSAPYMTKIVKASLATTYWISQAEGPLPAIEIEFTSIPEFALPEETTEINVTINSLWGGVVTPGSEQIHFTIANGPLDSNPLTNLGGGAYRADLLASVCDSNFSFYLSADEQAAGIFYSPNPGTPFNMIVAAEYLINFSDNFETDQGWTTIGSASTGQWQRGTPVSDNSWSYDPFSDGDGSGQCFLTQNELGNTDIDGGSVSLISPVIDFSNGGQIEYDYYLRMNNPAGVDMILVEGNDGGGWKEITRHTQNQGVYWSHIDITEEDILSTGLTKTETFQIRYTASDLTPASIVEAGIDGFKLSFYNCYMGCCGQNYAGLTGNTDCSLDGIVDLSDITRLIDKVYISKEELCCPENGNTSGDPGAIVDLSDITRLIDHVYLSKDDTESCQ